jgi:LuxR family transcriptional regulator, maltose regulon positive regulatory protein
MSPDPGGATANDFEAPLCGLCAPEATRNVDGVRERRGLATRLDETPAVGEPSAAIDVRRTWAPGPRPGLVARTRLLDVMLASSASVATVVAPPGYGKTTLLAQLADRLAPQVAWVACDELAPDPVALWTVVLAALKPLAPSGWPAPSVLTTSGGDLSAVPRLVASFALIKGPVALVLDNAEAIRPRECWTALSELALRLPRGWRLVLGSREELPIPISRLRLQEGVLELRADDLAMQPSEARSLLRSAGVSVSRSQAADLVRQTEGWPAGLYLAAVEMREGGTKPGFTFTGDDRLMRDYLRSELLSRASARERTFLTQSSILDRMSGPLCDAVVAGSGSSRMLEDLEKQNLLVIPLDRRGEWYRYHHLLRELMLSELRNEDPELVRSLHRRAAAWFVEEGEPQQAIAHAQAAGDTDEVAGLVLDAMQPVWASGRVETVRSWMEWLSRRSSPTFYAAIAAHAALTYALLGRPGEAERWTAAAESLPATGVLPDGSTEQATLAYLRAILTREGPKASREDALEAMDGLSPVSPYRATMVHTIGLSRLLEDDLDGADLAFADAYDLAMGSQALPLAAMVLAERHLVARARGNLAKADAEIDSAVRLVEGHGLDSFWTSALVFAAAARSTAHRGELVEARRHVRRAASLRPLLTHLLPVVSVQALIELAHAYLELVDPAGAEAALNQASAIMVRRPDLGNLADACADLRARLSQLTKSPAAGLSSLTAAELRLLPLLPTHLSFPQIADELYVSRYTVKSQVASVYRKLGVSSRRAAVDRMVQLGLEA